MTNTIRIGTRKSKLAVWQAEFVADKLKAGGLSTELVLIETKGDQVLDVAISKIGSKGVFTEELETMLASSAIDIAVHSAKDLQSHLPEGFSIIAYTEREIVNDVLISRNSQHKLTSDQHLIVGTSSTRRRAILAHYFPHVQTVDIRGNLQTRIARMDEGRCDAIILAYAGVHRMGYDNLICELLDTNIFTPPVGQGCIAIEASDTLEQHKKDRLVSLLNHAHTEIELTAERAFLYKLHGGCSIPAFALARRNGSNTLKLLAGIYSLDGTKSVIKKIEAPENEALKTGLTLAEEILNNGGSEILKEIRQQLDQN